MNHSPLNIVFLGTPEFAVPTLNKIANNKNTHILAVFSHPDKKIGRKQILTPTPVKICAKKYNIPVYQPENINSKDNIQILKDLKPDILVVVAYGKILSREILSIPTIAPINIHGSLLPLHRGASPIQQSILNGDKKTGITLQKMEYEMDAGDIILKSELTLTHNENSQTLFTKLSELGAEIMNKLINSITINNNKLPKTYKQNHNLATYCTKIQKKDGFIDFLQDSIYDIDRKLRAYTPWPGIYTYYNNKRLKILDINHSHTSDKYGENGEIVQTPHGTGVQCKDGIIIINTLQLEGKKSTSIQSFLQGNEEFIGSKLSSKNTK